MNSELACACVRCSAQLSALVQQRADSVSLHCQLSLCLALLRPSRVSERVEASPEDQQQHEQPAAADARPHRLVSNLDYAVSEQDLNELFANVGPLISCTIDFDARCACVCARLSRGVLLELAVSSKQDLNELFADMVTPASPPSLDGGD